MRRSAPFIAALLALALVGAACNSKKGTSLSDTQAAAAKLEQASATSAGAILRATLGRAMGEHVALIAAASAATIQGRAADAAEASDRLLGQNATDLATAFGTVYPNAQANFQTLWKKHIAFFLDYAAAAAKSDAAGEKRALDDLDTYALTFATFLNGQDPQLSKDDVVSLFREHATTLVAVIDAQAAKDYPKEYAALLAAYSHMDAIGAALATAFRAAHPEKVQGTPDSKPAALRAQLDVALQEQSVLLASMGAAIAQKRAPDAAAAVDVLQNTNVNDVASIFGTQYDLNTETKVRQSWASQIPMYENLARAIVAKNATVAAKYRDQLAASADAFGKIVNGACPGLDAGAMADILKLNMLSVKEVFAQLAGNSFGDADDALMRAVTHMDDLAAAIADGISKQFPDKFV
ncbi:MAG: hypothetical protein ACXVQS_04160 [Actinomycetota bacterium]